MEFGTVKCSYCKGVGMNLRMEGDCEPCEGTGWLTPSRQRALAARPEPKVLLDPEVPGEDLVIGASDAIRPVVQDNPFSQEALDKAIRRGGPQAKRRIILHDLYDAWPQGMSSWQFQQRYGWLHQSTGPQLGALHREGLLSIVGWRIKELTGNREGIYALSARAKEVWDNR